MKRNDYTQKVSSTKHIARRQPLPFPLTLIAYPTPGHGDVVKTSLPTPRQGDKFVKTSFPTPRQGDKFVVAKVT